MRRGRAAEYLLYGVSKLAARLCYLYFGQLLRYFHVYGPAAA